MKKKKEREKDEFKMCCFFLVQSNFTKRNDKLSFDVIIIFFKKVN